MQVGVSGNLSVCLFRKQLLKMFFGSMFPFGTVYIVEAAQHFSFPGGRVLVSLARPRLFVATVSFAIVPLINASNPNFCSSQRTAHVEAAFVSYYV